MEAMWQYAKDNALALMAIVISLFALFQNYRSDKSKLRSEIAKKKARVKALKSSSQMGGEFHQLEANRIKIAELEAEIEQLERLL